MLAISAQSKGCHSKSQSYFSSSGLVRTIHLVKHLMNSSILLRPVCIFDVVAEKSIDLLLLVSPSLNPIYWQNCPASSPQHGRIPLPLCSREGILIKFPGAPAGNILVSTTPRTGRYSLFYVFSLPQEFSLPLTLESDIWTSMEQCQYQYLNTPGAKLVAWLGFRLFHVSLVGHGKQIRFWQSSNIVF